MDIVKAFNTNDLHTEIIIKGTIDEPLFRASDIGVVLELSNIRATIIDFDEWEKVVNKVDTLGGTQEVTFLTEKGLYEKIRGTREEVWCGSAYQTTGELKKMDLEMNKYGKIVSKVKYIRATMDNNFIKYGVLKPSQLKSNANANKE